MTAILVLSHPLQDNPSTARRSPEPRSFLGDLLGNLCPAQGSAHLPTYGKSGTIREKIEQTDVAPHKCRAPGKSQKGQNKAIIRMSHQHTRTTPTSYQKHHLATI